MSAARSTLVARLGVLAVRTGFVLGRLRPVRAHVVLGGAEGARQAGNLLYIRRELERRAPRIPVRFVGYQTRPGLRGRIAGAVGALRAGYHLASARLFVVQDSFFPMDAITPRQGTVRVQVWHAAGALKKFGYSELDVSSGPGRDSDRLVPLHANYDICLVSSSAAIAHYVDAFHLPRDRFTAAVGLPRTDLFFDPDRRARAVEAIRRRYSLPAGRRVLLYTPTFRGDPVHSARHDDSLDLALLRDVLSPDWLLLLRLHPLVRESVSLGQDLSGFALDVSDWPDINELMLVADLLVTDYSSAIFEFALLERPMAFFAPDLDAYERERGFYFDYRTGVPGPVFHTSRDLADHVAAGGFDVEPVRAFARRWFDMADGHAAERFVDRVVLPVLRGEPIRLEAGRPPAERPSPSPGLTSAAGIPIEDERRTRG
jgi:teichoic acid ribitol-phosphate primase